MGDGYQTKRREDTEEEIDRSGTRRWWFMPWTEGLEEGSEYKGSKRMGDGWNKRRVRIVLRIRPHTPSLLDSFKDFEPLVGMVSIGEPFQGGEP